MYVTKPLSHCIQFPNSLLSPPDEGPNCGYLVLQDVEIESYNCLGCKTSDLIHLPFPQNKNLIIRYDEGESTYDKDVVFIPVLNQPLSSNRYYAIKLRGSHKGEAFTCSNEENTATCCFSTIDASPSPLNPLDIYQQYEIGPYPTCCDEEGSFYAKSIAPDGYPPNFLRTEGWRVHTKIPNYELGEALGLNTALRERLPEFNSESVVVGKWYCPFVFIREGTLRDQVKRSLFYEMTLEQKWEKIFTCANNYSEKNDVFVDVDVQREVVFVDGKEAVWDEKKMFDRVIWFTSFGSVGEEIRVGLSLEIFQRMKWEEERGGWVSGENRQVKVERVEEFGGSGGWRKFGCYVLVERFVLKRMDRSLVMTYDFKHTHQIKSKWE